MKFNTNATIAKLFVNHFNKIFVGTENPSFLIDNLKWRPINSKYHTRCAAFEDKKIKKAIFSFNNNKAPGPDGFTMTFYKTFWHLLRMIFSLLVEISTLKKSLKKMSTTPTSLL